jgi:hypothetical protein
MKHVVFMLYCEEKKGLRGSYVEAEKSDDRQIESFVLILMIGGRMFRRKKNITTIKKAD